MSKIAAHATWTDPTILMMMWRYYETPHHDTVRCEFSKDGTEVAIEFRSSIVEKTLTAKDARGVIRGKVA